MEIAALVAMIDKMNDATSCAERSIDDALAAVAASNARIEKMESDAVALQQYQQPLS